MTTSAAAWATACRWKPGGDPPGGLTGRHPTRAGHNPPGLATIGDCFFNIRSTLSIDLKQLSARLGLSVTTVSRALNGYSDVSAATRERVQKLAQELGYRANLAARRLARGQADAVGLVYPLEAGDLGDPRFLEVIEGLSDTLEAAQMDLLLVSARAQTELRTYQRLTGGGHVDGLIVARTRVQDERIELLRKEATPFVAYGRSTGSESFPWFDFDNQAGAALAVQQALALGHRRLAYLHAPLTLNFAAQRKAGFEAAMAQSGLTPWPALTLEAGLSRRGGHAATLQLLAAPEAERPTAIITDNNLCGLGVVRALLDRGVAIGREISVIVYDGVPADNLLAGMTIAAIEQPTAYEAGQTMAEMLLARIQSPEGAPQQVLRQPVFAAGSSLGPAP
jgi:LacI family transcriptional regulator